MVAVGEIENKVLSQFQSHVHSHLQGLHGAARATDLFIEFQQEGSCKKQVINESGGKNIKNPSEDIELFNFNTIRKMCALRNVRNRLQIDSVQAFILCLPRMSIFLSGFRGSEMSLFFPSTK